VHVIALEYHDVVSGDAWAQSGFPGADAATYKLSLAGFVQHLDAVASARVHVCNDARELVGGVASARPVLWTFDDGGASYALHVADALEQRGWRGHVFMTTGQVGSRGFLSAADLRDLHRRGHVIGTHSRTHPAWISALAASVVGEEWRVSLEDLEDVLGERVTVGSVPGGFFSPMVARQAALHGIRTLFTSEPTTRSATIDDCTIIGRFTLRRGHSASYVSRLVAPAPTARAGQWFAWNARKVAKRLAGPVYRALRERILGS
jgi:peptidoglycan/xylan/chitin deacetylase (PgdA/CDA1 family)